MRGALLNHIIIKVLSPSSHHNLIINQTGCHIQSRGTWRRAETKEKRQDCLLNSPLKDNECHFMPNFLKQNCKLVLPQTNCGEKRSDICRARTASASLPSQYGCTASFKVWKSTFVSIHMDFLDVLQTAGIISRPALLHHISGLTLLPFTLAEGSFH